MPPRSPPAARFSSSLPFSHSVIRPTTGSGVGPNSVELASAMPAQIARRLDHRHLHAEADAEIGHMAFAGELRRADLAFGAALAEAARHQDAVDVFQERRRVLVLEHLGFDPVELDLDLVGDAAMRQRLDQRFVGVLQAGVFADDGDRDLAFGIADALVDHVASASRSGARRGVDAERRQHFAVETLGVIGLRHRVDVVDVARLDHGAFAHVAEQRRSCAAPPSGSARSERHSRMSGWMPIERSSLTECWVGLVFSSPALGMNGTSVRWM